MIHAFAYAAVSKQVKLTLCSRVSVLSASPRRRFFCAAARSAQDDVGDVEEEAELTPVLTRNVSQKVLMPAWAVQGFA